MKQHTHRRQCPSWNLFLLMIVLACSPHFGRQQINPAFRVDPQTGDVTLEEGTYIITTPEGYPVECKRESEYNCEQNAAQEGDTRGALKVEHQQVPDDDKLAETVTYHKSDKGVVLQCTGYAVTDCSPAEPEGPQPGTLENIGPVMADPQGSEPVAVKGTGANPSPNQGAAPSSAPESATGSGNNSDLAEGDSPESEESDIDSDKDKGNSGIPMPTLPGGKDVDKKLRDFGKKIETAFGEINGQNKKKRKKAREIRRMVAELADLERQVKELADQVMSEFNEVNQSLGALDRIEDFHSRAEIDGLINQAGREHNKMSEDIIGSLPNPDDYDSGQVADEEIKSPQPVASSKHRQLNTANTYRDYVQERVEEMPEGVAKGHARKLVSGATGAFKKAEEYYDGGDQGAGDFAKELGIAMLDIALGFVPFVGVSKDVFELFTGQNAITGEKLSPFELTMAGIGVASAGVLSGVKNVPKGFKILKEVLEHSDEGADSAKAADEGLDIWTSLEKSDISKDEIITSAKEGEWATVFASGYRPKDLIQNKPFLDEFRKDMNIPDHWEVGPAKKGDGLSFSKPGTNKADEMRIKEGIPSSEFHNSREPNVRLKKDGAWRDIDGKEVPLKSEDAHIPLAGFKFPDWF